MAAISRFRATRQPPLPLKALIPYEDYPTKRIVNHVNTTPEDGANATTYKVKKDLPYAPDSTDKERLICVLDSYQDACGAEILNIQDEKRHARAREVLGGALRNTWSSMLRTATNKRNVDFVSNARSFLRSHMLPNAFHIQREYFLQATKPLDMDCFTTASRLRYINDISVYLPGSSGNKLFTSDTQLKNAFYRLMLPNWQLNFDCTGNQLDDDNYTLQRLVNYMEQQRLHHDAVQQRGRRRRRSSSFDYHQGDRCRRRLNSSSEYHQGDQYNQYEQYDHQYDQYDQYDQHDQYDQYDQHYQYDQYHDQYDQYDQYDQSNQYGYHDSY